MSGVIWFLRHYTRGWGRLWSHLWGRRYAYLPKHYERSHIIWWGDLVCYILEVCGIPIVYIVIQSLMYWRKPPRRLSEYEIMTLKSIFEDSIAYDYVYVNNAMSKYLSSYAYAFVALNMINYRSHIPESILVHEGMHIHQYQRYGIVYAFRALMAQRTAANYNYGGGQAVFDAMIRGDKLHTFNFEQQAQLVEDYYNLTSDMTYSPPAILHSAYSFYIAELQDA